MVIHAIYENGVFRPIDAVELPESSRVRLVVQECKTEGEQQPAAAPLAGIAAIAISHPENPSLPTDLAEQHDHYLYGASRRS